MPEQMSGLKPTWQDTQWYEQQKEKERTQQAQGFAGQTGVIGEALMSLGGYAKDAFKENSDHPIARMALDMLGGLGDADYMAKTQATTMHGETGGQFLGALEVADTAVSLGATGALRNAPRLAREAVEAGAKDIQSLGVGQATLQAARDLGDKIPPMGPQLQMQLAGATNTGSFAGARMQDLQPPTVMKYSDEQLATLGTGPSNRSTLEGLDPKYRYFDEESLRDMQGPMTDREPAIRKAEQIEEQWVKRLEEAEASGDKRAIKYAKKKLKEARRKANDLISGPPEEIVPNNPQTYHSSPASRAAREQGGVDAEGNPRVDLHHQTLENTEGGRLFRRKKVLKDSPQGGVLYWEHLRRLGIVPGGGSRNMRALSALEHTGAGGMHVGLMKWRAFFEKLPDDISLNDLFKKTEEFAASLDDSDKYLESIGLPTIPRDVPEGVLMRNQAGRLIDEVQRN